jgi:adenine deaminase
MASVHGMVATVSDPHEIANVLGMEGVQFMLDNAAQTNFNFFFGAPSCVPATQFETAGAMLGIKEVEQLLDNLKILYLAEVMNFPGVLAGDEEMLAKINAALKRNKQVDGHAPGLRGEEAIAYANAGITTDHECFTLDEALDKIAAGMKIQIREGSAAKNFEALHSLLGTHPGKVMLCSDDKHPDNLQLGHINLLVKRALKKGHDLFDVLRAASYNTKAHYKLPVGMLQVGDSADFIEIDNLSKFNILRTWINGALVAENGKSYLKSFEAEIINKFESRTIEEKDLQIKHEGKTNIHVIEALEGQLITNKVIAEAKIDGDFIDTNIEKDILKICVVNRYEDKPPAIAFIKNIGIKKGAFASTVAHDSHNIVAVACDDKTLCRAINLLMENKGGLCATDGKKDEVLPLPVAGLMTNEDAFETTDKYITLDQFVKNELGSTLQAPFMTLSFMALLVIPHLKLSDKGLFDGDEFKFTSVVV